MEIVSEDQLIEASTSSVLVALNAGIAWQKMRTGLWYSAGGGQPVTSQAIFLHGGPLRMIYTPDTSKEMGE